MIQSELAVQDMCVCGSQQSDSCHVFVLSENYSCAFFSRKSFKMTYFYFALKNKPKCTSTEQEQHHKYKEFQKGLYSSENANEIIPKWYSGNF